MWEWKDDKVMIYEFPSKPHETCISAINKIIVHACGAVDYANSRIVSLGATSKYQLLIYHLGLIIIIWYKIFLLKELVPMIPEKKPILVFARRKHVFQHPTEVTERYFCSSY